MGNRITFMPSTSSWRCVLTLDEGRRPIGGDAAELRAAIGRGADLRIYSEFVYNEHIEPGSTCDEPIQECMDMRCTYLVDSRWAAGILTLRQPVELPQGFGPRPSLSLFLYNENGEQAIARPYLDGAYLDGAYLDEASPDGSLSSGKRGPAPPGDHARMPRYHELDNWDAGTNAPSSNFIYDFGVLKFLVRDDWRQCMAHDATGNILSGSVEELSAAFADGAEVKVGIRGLCDDLAAGQPAPAHEVFIQCGSCYYFTRRRLFIAGTHPLVRVAPGIPLRYASDNWDYAWLVVRSDGHVAMLRYDPYTLAPKKIEQKLAVRWFVR